VLVRELIAETIWLPSGDYANTTPRLSVLMPVFRGRREGLFARAAASILDQSLRDLELIIIDDGSVDGTADDIDALMARDPRVSCLRHPHNIGLPAISEYEAFTRARGAFFAFAFEDFVFADESLAGLLGAAESDPFSAVHGYAEWVDGEGRLHYYGKDVVDYLRLRYYNFLANSSFIVPRAILEEVGLYDPHIAATRLNDWDLWRRILFKFPIRQVPILVGRENGVSLGESLGNTYPLYQEVIQEYFNNPRDEKLRASRFVDYDVWDIPPDSSAALTIYILTMRRFFAMHRWARDLAQQLHPIDVSEASKKLVLGVFIDLETDLTPSLIEAAKTSTISIHYFPPLGELAEIAAVLSQVSAVVIVNESSVRQMDELRNVCTLLQVPILSANDSVSACRIALRPVDTLEWIKRLRILVQRVNRNELHRLQDELTAANIRLEKTRVDLRKVCEEFEEARSELRAQLSSRTFRLALQFRRISVFLRKLLGVGY
jgi:hypothetical protein